jgi:hypothetical protein
VVNPARLPNVFWLGGGCGAGKTTVARVLTRRLDLRLYPVDAYTYAHLGRIAAGPFPRSQAVNAMTREQRFSRDPAALADSFLATSAERLTIVLADLRELGPGPTIVVEGPQLFPELVAPLMQTPEHGLWLLPSADFGRLGVAGRATFLADAAMRRRYERDVRLTQVNREQTARHGLRAIEVDGTLSLAETLDAVTAQLQNLPGGLVTARDGRHRQLIRQAENAVAAAQLRAWWQDTGPDRMPDPPVFEFSCECQTPGCEQVVGLPVTGYQQRSAAGPVTREPHP